MPKVRFLMDEDDREMKIAVLVSLKEIIGLFSQNISSIEPMVRSVIMNMAGGIFRKEGEEYVQEGKKRGRRR